MVAPILKLGRVIYEAVAVFVRAASPTTFAAEVLTVVTTAGESDWATWRRFGLSLRFWTGLGQLSGLVAFVCVVACLLLAAVRLSCPEEDLTDTGWCPWFNVPTIVLLFLVPAIAAV